MITMTDPAKAELDAFFEGKDMPSCIRVFLAPGG